MARTAPAPADKTENWDEAEATAAAVQSGLVQVRCIVHTFPHTGLANEGLKGLGMAHKEVREVPQDVALLMHERGQVEIL
jgi:hypothetical protein